MPDRNEQAMQQFVNQSPLDPSSVMNRLVAVIVDYLHPSPGVLVLDDTTLPQLSSDINSYEVRRHVLFRPRLG